MEELKLSQKEIDQYNRVYSQNRVAYNANSLINRTSVYMHKILKLLLDNYHEAEYKERDFSREDMIKIVHDFFKTIDDQLFIMLTGVLNDQSVRVFIDQPSCVNKEKNNYSTFIDGKRVLSISPTNNISGLLQMCHEMSHMLSQRMQRKLRPKDPSIGEIEALFMEKVFAFYLLVNNIMTDEECQQFVAERNNKMMRDIIYCINRAEVMKLIDGKLTTEGVKKIDTLTKNSPKRDIIIKKLKEMSYVDKVDMRRSHNYHPVERYVIGQIASTVLFDRFMKDREPTMETFKNYLAHSSEITLSEAVQELFNMNFRELAKEYYSIKESELASPENSD